MVHDDGDAAAGVPVPDYMGVHVQNLIKAIGPLL